MRDTVLADRYRLVDWLGGGSMGDVWLAEDEVLGRRVAVKLVKAALLEEPGFAERFHAEARVMAQLRHPGIVGVYDYGHDTIDGQRSVGYLVMELIDGEPLSAVLERRGALPVAEALQLALQVLEALEVAHESGVVHRDIKPANLMVRGDRTVIADFGIARPGCDARLTVPGVVLGTAAYQAPEQASTGTVTASADLYALGVVLHECLAGQLPFDGETALEVILKHLTEPVPPLPEEVPAPVRALVGRAMAKESGERWSDAAAMATAVREALAAVGEEVPAAPERPRSRPVAAARTARTRPGPRALVGVTALVLLCMGGAAGATVIRPDREAAPAGASAAGVADPGVPGVPGMPISALTEERPLAAPQTGAATAPAPSDGPSAGAGSPAPDAGPGPVTGPTPAVPGPSPAVPAAGPNPAPPAPVPTAPAPPAVRDPATQPPPATREPTPPNPPATSEPATPSTTPQPTQSPRPTQPPAPQLPTTATQITANGAALDNYQSKNEDGNGINTYYANGTLAQTWRLEKIAGGKYYLRNGASGYTKVLDLDKGTRKVQIWTNPPAAENQIWDLVPVEGGYLIVNDWSKECLTSYGVGYWAGVSACSNAKGQVWAIS
ncbi:protein kinase [Kitasatospora sp. NPDC127059]|uniref:protein kinase domain-containing protein n=1 Tax=unclassified Kitasatospora TaxID=2633591 RepID=UPI00365B30BA